MKKCSTSPVIKEMEIKIMMKYNLTPVRLSIIKKLIKIFEEFVEKRHDATTIKILKIPPQI